MKPKMILLAFVFSLKAICLFGQKKPLDSIAYEKWTSVQSPVISDNGKYVAYHVKNRSENHKTMIIQSTTNKWKKEITGAEDWSKIMSSDSRDLFFQKGEDSLGILKMGTNQLEYISNVSIFEMKDKWLCYHLKDQKKTLVMRNLNTGLENSYNGVIGSWFGNDNKVIVLKTIREDNSQSLDLISLQSGLNYNIWTGENIDNLVLDQMHPQLAFKVNDKIMYYKLGETAKCVSEKISMMSCKDMKVARLVRFSNDGQLLFLDLKKDARSTGEDNVAEIWSYLDSKLYSEQITGNDEVYLAALNLSYNDVYLIGSGIVNFPAFLNSKDTIALVQDWKSLGEPWSISSNIKSRLVSAKNGKVTELYFLDDNRNVSISPFGKFLLYFDSMLNSYFSYEIATGRIRNITENIHISWADLRFTENPSNIPRGIGCWFKDDAALLIFDAYDIWKVDPLNNHKPVNITNGYGKKNSIVFDLALSSYKQNGIIEGRNLYLGAFNTITKDNGFFRKNTHDFGDPQLLVMSPVYYNSSASYYMPSGSDFSPVKAKDKNEYIVRRMSATESPNYFMTSDFRKLKPLSDLQPEKDYNWYTTEMLSWTSLNGQALQGVLYKPANFDAKRKYPVIFNYYERKSDGLNAYIKPEPLCDGCNINIPSYVSQGYLVFTPDIHFKIGDPMQGTYDAIVSAAKYLTTLNYVNSKKMGLQGCSWGGLQTNYLITHTDLFAAACSASGIADLVSAYGSLNGVEGEQQYESRQFYFEGLGQQGRMGGSLWDKLDSYIKSSPVFQIDKVKTPILIMHGKKDGRCSYYNVLEFFTGLRRLGKRAWMLIYPNAGHGIEDKQEANDFSTKMMQFFDYYLKDKSEPIWMFNKLKHENFSSDIFRKDLLDKEVNRGLLKASERVKVDSLMNNKPTTISLR